MARWVATFTSGSPEDSKTPGDRSPGVCFAKVANVLRLFRYIQLPEGSTTFGSPLEMGDSWEATTGPHTPLFRLLHFLISITRSGEVERFDFRSRAAGVELGEPVSEKPVGGGSGLPF